MVAEGPCRSARGGIDSLGGDFVEAGEVWIYIILPAFNKLNPNTICLLILARSYLLLINLPSEF